MPSTGGVNIGPIGQLEGHIPGFRTAVRLASKTPELTEIGRQFQMLRGSNDSPVGHVLGSWAGRAVRNGPSQETAWSPAL